MHQAELQHETIELDLSTTPDVAFTCIVEARLGDELSTQHCPTPLRRGEKQYLNVLLNNFHFSVHTLGFHPQPCTTLHSKINNITYKYC